MFIVSSESFRPGRFSSILLHGCSTRSKEHGFCLRHIKYHIISDTPILEIKELAIDSRLSIAKIRYRQPAVNSELSLLTASYIFIYILLFLCVYYKK